MANVFLNIPAVFQFDQIGCLLFGCGTDVTFSNQFDATPLDLGFIGLLYRTGVFGLFAFLLFSAKQYRRYFFPSVLTLIHYPVFFSLSGALVLLLLGLCNPRCDERNRTITNSH